MQIQLTKTDFTQYLNCPKSLWALKREPDTYLRGEFSVFQQKLTREGYEVERYVRQYFDAIDERVVDFQRVFETDSGLFARADAFETTEGGETILYEIKSSTSMKTDADHNHKEPTSSNEDDASRTARTHARTRTDLATRQT